MNSDVIIIGAGPGGYETAVYAAKKGLSVTLFEQRKAGGTCLHEGCIPTKCLCRSAEIADTITDCDTWGFRAGFLKWYCLSWRYIRQLSGAVDCQIAPGGHRNQRSRSKGWLFACQAQKWNFCWRCTKSIRRRSCTGKLLRSHWKRKSLQRIQTMRFQTGMAAH